MDHLNNLDNETVIRLWKPLTRQQWIDSATFYLCFQIKSTFTAWNCIDWQDNIAEKLGYQLNFPNSSIKDNIIIRRRLKYQKHLLFVSDIGCFYVMGAQDIFYLCN